MEYDEEDGEGDQSEEIEEVKSLEKPLSKLKQKESGKISLILDNPDIEKALRSVLNKVSEGNIEVMFTSLMDVVKLHVGKGNGKPS